MYSAPPCRRVLLCLCCCLLTVVCCRAAFAAQDSLFKVRGIGGGGGVFNINISPFDPDFMLVASDMGGVFRSRNGGESWEIISHHQGLYRVHSGPRPQFLPNGRIYWVTGRKQLCFSDDKAVTWTIQSPGPWQIPPQGGERKKALVEDFVVLPGAEETLLVSGFYGVWLGREKGWKPVSRERGGPVLALGNALFVACGEGLLLRSRDNGLSWQKLQPMSGRIVGLSGAMDSKGKSIMLASVEGKGLCLSRDMGESWQLSKTPYENEKVLVVPPGQTELLFAMQRNYSKNRKLLRSHDGGASWESIFTMNPNSKSCNVAPSWPQTELRWGYYFTNNGLAVSPRNPDHCFVTTQGELFASKDGGRSWTQAMSKELPAKEKDFGRYGSIGLEITSCWGYHFDPHDPEREYIAYTDLGFARSLDKGRSWSWSARGARWTNTFYDLAFDPDKPGKLYAAASTRHDIPHYLSVNIAPPGFRVNQGGLLVSTNGGARWKIPYKIKGDNGLPHHICTTVVLDPSSPPERRRLYAGIFGEHDKAGVYVSEDDGATWQQTESQPGVLPNRHVYRLRLHPKTGDLYCLITGLRGKKPDFFNVEGGGIWMSSDKGQRWRHLSAGSPLNRWTTAFAFDPEDSNVLYAASASPQGGDSAGGIFKTYDGGQQWFHILTNAEAKRLAGNPNHDHWMAVAVHPDNNALVFAGSSLHGLFFSRDGGRIWKWCKDFPFGNAQSITFNPRNTDELIVTTFGAGVWSASVAALLAAY